MQSPRHGLKPVVVAALLLLCSGCGYLFGDKGVFRDRSEDYKKSREVPALKVPEGMDSSSLGEMYPIPPIADQVILAGEFEVPRPAPLVAGAIDEQVRIQMLGDESWVLVSTAPGQLWPQVRSFLSTSQIPVARVDARAGLIESSWVQLQGAALRSRFRFRIDQGVQRGTSELHVLQMNEGGDEDSWPAVSDDDKQEDEMMRALAQFVANSADSTPVSMVADQAISSVGKISMQEGPGGDIYIRLTLPFDRAWASVGRAIEESDFEITDRDRSAGKYYARFLGPDSDDESGWFDWLFGGDSEHPLAGQPFVISVTPLDETDVGIRLKAQQPEDGEDTVDIEKRDEQALLALIKGNID